MKSFKDYTNSELVSFLVNAMNREGSAMLRLHSFYNEDDKSIFCEIRTKKYELIQEAQAAYLEATKVATVEPVQEINEVATVKPVEEDTHIWGNGAFRTKKGLNFHELMRDIKFGKFVFDVDYLFISNNGTTLNASFAFAKDKLQLFSVGKINVHSNTSIIKDLYNACKLHAIKV